MRRRMCVVGKATKTSYATRSQNSDDNTNIHNSFCSEQKSEVQRFTKSYNDVICKLKTTTENEKKYHSFASLNVCMEMEF